MTNLSKFTLIINAKTLQLKFLTWLAAKLQRKSRGNASSAAASLIRRRGKSENDKNEAGKAKKNLWSLFSGVLSLRLRCASLPVPRCKIQEAAAV